jgi:excisionase family DNA binding protein
MRKKQTTSKSLPPFGYAGSRARDFDPAASAERLLTAGEVARVLRVSRSTVYDLIRGGSLPAVRVGDVLRVRTRAVQAYVAKRSGPIRRRVPRRRKR